MNLKIIISVLNSILWTIFNNLSNNSKKSTFIERNDNHSKRHGDQIVKIPNFEMDFKLF